MEIRVAPNPVFATIIGQRLNNENPNCGENMNRTLWYHWLVIVLCLTTHPVFGQDKKLVNALSIPPTFKSEVQYDTPTREELKNCKLVDAEPRVGTAGWAVIDATDRILRLYLDNNGDGRLDQWSFFKDGIEVYREVDTDDDKKRNEYRWMGSQGTRWGIDVDQDKSIDKWKMISAEEVTREVFLAIQNNDVARYQAVLLKSSEIPELRLGETMEATIQERMKATSKFKQLVARQKKINKTSEFSGFGTSRPALIPKGTSSLKKDLVIYDHASAMFKTGKEYGQVAVGTIIQVEPNRWSALELPQLATEGTAVANGGAFNPPIGGTASTAVAVSAEVEKISKLFGELDTAEKALKKAKRESEIEKLEKRRADIMGSIVKNTKSKEDRQNWIRSLADQVADAYQRDRFPTGLQYLDGFIEDLDNAADVDIAYVNWRMINARWSKGLERDRVGREESNELYYKELSTFIDDFPKSEFAPQAIMHLANNAEINQETKEAIKWYKRLAAKEGNTMIGRRAKGALVRLDSDGSALRFSGKTVSGKRFDVSRYKGKVVLIHYWDTDCELCTDVFEELQRINAKYKSDLVLVGANLDDDRNALRSYLAKNRNVNWLQLWEEGGGYDSPLALQLGVSVMPTMVLIDQRGRMVESNLPVSDLDREIQRLQKRNARRGN